MIRRSALVLLLSVFVLMGGTCPVPSIGVTCANDLDGSEFGFTLSVPTDFSCIEVYPQSLFQVSARFRQAVTRNVASIIVTDPIEIVDEEGLTIEETGTTTNNNGVEARRFKLTATSEGLTVYSHVALITLPSGSQLSVTLANDNDNAELLTAFDAILATVAFTQG